MEATKRSESGKKKVIINNKAVESTLSSKFMDNVEAIPE
jgi:hypothetical protein